MQFIHVRMALTEAAAGFATPPAPHRRGRSASIEEFLEIRTDPNMASPALMRSPLIRDRSDPRMVRERGASLYGTPRGGALALGQSFGWLGSMMMTLTFVLASRSTHIAGRSGSGGMRVGSYTPASYGSVTTFASSSYQYRVRAWVDALVSLVNEGRRTN